SSRVNVRKPPRKVTGSFKQPGGAEGVRWRRAVRQVRQYYRPHPAVPRPGRRGCPAVALPNSVESPLFEALQPVKEAGDLSARPARALVPELQQRVTVESDPRGDQRRALSNDVVRQAVRYYPWRVSDRHRAARLRFPRPAIEVLHARPVPA